MTYLPKHFEVADLAACHALAQAHPLATWVMPHDGELLVNHIPWLLDMERGEHGTLVGHVARANPVWQVVGEAIGVAVFQGSEAYISPNWYPSKQAHGKAVPTWNYEVVHAHGVARMFEDRERLRALVSALTARHEAHQAQPWQLSDAPADYIELMLDAIVGIEIPVTRWVGKRKASQNRPRADRDGVAQGLRVRAWPLDTAMAALVEPEPRGD